MTPEVELDQISPEVFVWHRYDHAVKAELFCTGIGVESGVWLIDSILIARAELAAVIGPRTVQGIIVTNVNHARDAGELSTLLGAAVFAHDDAVAELELPPQVEILSSSAIAQLAVIPIVGAPRGEIALHCGRDGGTLVVGDALINMGSYGFTFLPAKYCEDSKLMRRSLRRLLDLRFERLLFAHGTPIVSAARQRLIALLQGDP